MVTYKTYTDVGSRNVNEDSILTCTRDDANMFVVADGLGGHGHGEYASALAVTTASEMFQGEYYEQAHGTEFLEQSFSCAQDIILTSQEEAREFSDMKTTMVSLLVEKDHIYWGHVGDSRLYYFQGNKLVTRTLDHSVPQMLVSTGEIKEKDIRGHEDRSRLLRVIGSPWINGHGYDISEGTEVDEAQAFLLCSDGFWEQIIEKDMIRCLKKAETVDEWLDSMAEIVRENGKGTNMDNNSAIAVWVNR